MDTGVITGNEHQTLSNEELERMRENWNNGGLDSHDIGRMFQEIDWLKIQQTNPRLELVSKSMTRDQFDEEFTKATDGEVTWSIPKILARVWKYVLIDGEHEEKILVAMWRSGILHYPRVFDGQYHEGDLVAFVGISQPVREG